MGNGFPSTRLHLLILTVIYCQGFVPASATIRVLSFLSAHLLPATHSLSVASSVSSSASDVINEIKTILKDYQCAKSDNSLWTEFLRIQHRIANLDALFDFFASLDQLFKTRDAGGESGSQIVLTRTSLLGSFVRHNRLEFEKLSFQNVVKLWQNFEALKRSIESEQGFPSFSSEDTEPVDGVEAADIASGGRISRILAPSVEDLEDRLSADSERLLVFQINQMQKFGSRIPHEIRMRLGDLSRPSQEVTSMSFYANFLDSWYAGDYPTSFEYLHRYYDYALHHKDRSQYQYALLNMAIFQADFGCYEEAVAAMQETIATARENKDTACLNFSLSWLFHLQTLLGGEVAKKAKSILMDSDAKNLSFLRARALDSKMWPIASTTILSEARLALSLGRPPYEAFEHIYESLHINVQHHQQTMLGPQLMEQAALFARLGIANLAHSHCKLITDCYSTDLLAADALHARCRNAYAAVLAGDYKAADKLLVGIKPDIQRNLQLHQFVETLKKLIQLKRHLLHNDLREAQLLLEPLRLSPCQDHDLRFQIALLRIDYAVRADEMDKAFSIVHTLFPDAEGYDKDPDTTFQCTDVYHQIKLLTTKALLFAKFRVPQKGLSIALRATMAAMKAKILPALWEATAALAGVLVSVDEADAARKLLDAVVWQATEGENLELVGLLFHTQADAAMGIAGKFQDEVGVRDGYVRGALTWLERARGAYEKLEDVLGEREVLAKMIVAERVVGDEKSAKEREGRFVELCKRSAI